jgi:hypothetical protein
MFTRIDDLPTGAIGFKASGRVALSDSRALMEPAIDSARAANGKVRLLYVAGPDFIGYKAGAIWDDTIFGTRHFCDFAKIAFVTDREPYDRAVHALEGLMPAELKVFQPQEIDAAKAWLAG